MPRQNFEVLRFGTCHQESENSSHEVSGFDGTGASEYYYEATVGVSRRKPRGWIPPTNYSYTFTNVQLAKGSASKTSPFGRTTWSGAIGSAGNPAGLFSSNDHFNEVCSDTVFRNAGDIVNQALIKARLAIKQQNVNLGAAFGERKQTAMLIGDTAIQIAESFKALKRGNVRQAATVLGVRTPKNLPKRGNVPRKWLELQYGWKPLLSDVYGACDALSKRPMSDWRVTGKGKATSDGDYSVTHPSLWNSPPGYQLTAKVERRAFCRIDAIPVNGATISLSSLGVTNPLSVAWELVPYSFVVDWFLPVGDWLNSLDAMFGYGESVASSSLLLRGEWRGSGMSGFFPDQGVRIDTAWKEQMKRVILTRTVTTGVPLPTFPSFKDPRSLGHMANGLALLTQAFR